ncbi:40S ribosomal S8 [Tubulinosema ratisbonensis]|uniref:40S ribosomal protein S8 n=1 Tax=Tubulinosema ratisbonensis TaxID=291195 RepID=A0A437AIW7_9MICR|nr:40S ribosomal S8 [Tubulinosema ratisbonensis]
MGLSGSNRHKRTKTGAKKSKHCKKRKFHLARQPSNTKIGDLKIQEVRVRGGNIKRRALKIDSGVFTLKSDQLTLKSSFNQVVYHPSSTELMRTNTITKGAVVRMKENPLKEKINFELYKEKDPIFYNNLMQDKVYAVIASRPGQCGRADGYFLQGEELAFYMDRLKKRNK